MPLRPNPNPEKVDPDKKPPMKPHEYERMLEEQKREKEEQELMLRDKRNSVKLNKLPQLSERLCLLVSMKYLKNGKTNLRMKLRVVSCGKCERL
jgi:hypothetical protein